jgi:pimeloyl-ACP methyl ester carboxylesterase
VNSQVLPPVRTTHTWHAPGGLWRYDMWGRKGRPVVLIPAIMFDRGMWWPAAADLRQHATVVAVDLPGHGTSTARGYYDPYELVDDLAELIHSLNLRRAPVVVGHGSSASLATLFAASYATHAVVTVDAPVAADCGTDLARYLDDMHLDAVPDPYRDMLTPARDPRLLAAYTTCRQTNDPLAIDVGMVATPGQLAVHSEAPPRRTREPAAPPDPWRHEIYDVPGRFAHVTDAHRFVHDIRALLSPHRSPTTQPAQDFVDRGGRPRSENGTMVGDTATYCFIVAGLRCARCGMLIDKALEDTVGVHRSRTCVRAGRTVVDVDAAFADAATVIAVIGSVGHAARLDPA